MTDPGRSPVLLVASPDELPDHSRVWGHGGWLPPEEREALDWLTLVRLLGWDVSVRRPTTASIAAGLADTTRWIILACNPGLLDDEAVALLERWLETRSVLLVARAGQPNTPVTRLAGAAQEPGVLTGGLLTWDGPGPRHEWRCRADLRADRLDRSANTEAWASLEGSPTVVGRSIGLGKVATIGWHPSEWRDIDGAATALLRQLLIWGVEPPVAWLDLERTLVLRMDDPGGAQNVYWKDWRYPKLTADQWAAIGADLARRRARLSIGYIAGWVDDGDGDRGILEVAGRPAPRRPGAIHPSPLVRYRDRAGHAPGTDYDCVEEFDAIQRLRQAGLVEVEAHGYTHMHPDSATWAQAPDRYEAEAWYREFGIPALPTIQARPTEEHPLVRAVAEITRFFGTQPTTVIFPGEKFTNEAVERALDLDLQLIGSYYLALRHEERFCWSQHVCAPYLNQPDEAWFVAGVPVVGYFHDRELVDDGVDWMTRWLDAWSAAGARRLIDYRELAATLGHRLRFTGSPSQPLLEVTSDGPLHFARSLPIRARLQNFGAKLEIRVDGDRRTLEVQPLDDGTVRLHLPSPDHTGARAPGRPAEPEQQPKRRGTCT